MRKKELINNYEYLCKEVRQLRSKVNQLELFKMKIKIKEEIEKSIKNNIKEITISYLYSITVSTIQELKEFILSNYFAFLLENIKIEVHGRFDDCVNFSIYLKLK